jgi:hypothetical protein
MLTNGGRDFMTAQMVGGTQGSISGASASALAIYFGLSADTTAPAVTDTTIGTELTANGLGRVAASVTTRSAGASSYTISKTFTYTGSTSVTIAKLGVWNAVSSGVLVFSTLLGVTATVTTNGDALTISQTVVLP